VIFFIRGYPHCSSRSSFPQCFSLSGGTSLLFMVSTVFFSIQGCPHCSDLVLHFLSLKKVDDCFKTLPSLIKSGTKFRVKKITFIPLTLLHGITIYRTQILFDKSYSTKNFGLHFRKFPVANRAVFSGIHWKRTTLSCKFLPGSFSSIWLSSRNSRKFSVQWFFSVSEIRELSDFLEPPQEISLPFVSLLKSFGIFG